LSRLILLVAAWSFVATLAGAPRSARAAGGCGAIVYSFQPDCYQPKGDGTCGQTIAHLDFGPQIAVWLETPDHTLVDTIMVTSLTATRGIGNRPGVWNFRSGPKFPYGKRWMSLPIWAYARGKLFDSAFMQDDRETWMGFHEAHSSKEPYFCRPVSPTEVNLNVDVITCPSQNFNSAKGKLEPTKSYYPPRNDLTMFTNSDCDNVGGTLATCHVSAATYGALNDLDAVAAATPPYGQPYTRTWNLPQGLPAGNYAVVVEVNKEYDTNASHSHMAYEDPNLASYGVDGNFGQPSVIYRVPVQVGGSTPTAAVTSQIAGYSSWFGDAPLDGTILPRDGTISSNVPGSGELRLLAFDGPGGNGRVHVSLARCPVACGDGGCPDAGSPDDGASSETGSSPDASVDGAPADASTPSGTCSPLPSLPTTVGALTVVASDATSATLSFVNASSVDSTVDGYDVRYRAGGIQSDMDLASGIPAAYLMAGASGTPTSVKVENLKPATTYTFGVRSVDACGQYSDFAVVSVETTVQKFTQLSGCFVATAAYGSVLEPEVAALRRARDRLRAESAIFTTATDLYYRSGPAAAAVVEKSGLARGLARRVIGPFAGLAEALEALASRPAGRSSSM
jgi:hypothetical protein